MTSLALHPTPKLRVVALEQVRVAGLALRKVGMVVLGLIGVMVLVTALKIIGVIHVNLVTVTPSSGSSIWLWPRSTLEIVLAGLFIPFGVWGSENPSRRSYHWTMPLSRGPHTLLRVLAGWLWLMLGAVTYLLFREGLAFVIRHTAQGAGGGVNFVPHFFWEWTVPFVAASLVYLFTSIAVIATDHPWRWIGGIVIASVVLLGFSDTLGHGLEDALMGTCGLFTALAGTQLSKVEGACTDPTLMPHALPWLKAVLLWGVIGGLGVCLAAYRYKDA